MSRNFDTWNKYTDNNGKVLKGCVMFNVKGGNTQAPIYDEDGTPLDNPILTDSYGRTDKQVFVDSDVTAYFYKYIGTGTYTTPTEDESVDEATIDVHDDTLWSLQYTVDSVLETTISVTGNNVDAVASISDLRGIDVETVTTVSGESVICLLGYDEPGDKEPVYYIWDPESTEQDDGGSVIKCSEPVGRWKLVKPTEHCDCRHFGIFPSNSTVGLTNYTNRIVALVSYCNSYGIRPYFVTNHDYRYYWISNAYISSVNEIDVGQNVQFECAGTNTLYVPRINGDPYFHGGTVNLYTDYVKSSWGGNAVSKYSNRSGATYLVDSAVSGLVLSGWTVEVQYPLSGASLASCVIKGMGSVSESAISSCTVDGNELLSEGNSYSSMKLTGNMFSGQPSVGAVSGCHADIVDFSNKVDLYLEITGKQNQIDYDWQSIVLYYNYKPVGSVVDADRTVAGFVSTSTGYSSFNESSSPHVYTFTDCKANIRLDGTAGSVYYFKNFTGSVNFVNYDYAFDVVFENSSVTLTSSLTAATVQVKDSSIVISGNKAVNSLSVKNSYFDAGNVTATNFTSLGSILVGTGPISTKNCLVKDTQINVAINGSEYKQSESDGFYVISCFFDNDIFNAQYSIAASQGPTKVAGTWTNNVGNVPNPISINRNNMYAYDYEHPYRYSGNTGTFDPEVGKATVKLDSSHIQHDSSGSYQVTDPGKILFYQKSGKLVMMQPAINTATVSTFHIGQVTDYLVTVRTVLAVQPQYTVGTINSSFTLYKEYSGDIPNVGWVNGTAVSIPDMGQLSDNDQYVTSCDLYLEFERV